jgi:putative acetyltransferase
VIVRRERAGDEGAIRRVVASAFAQGAPAGAEPVEVALLDALRAGTEWIAPLSLVAVDGDDIVGHVVCSRAWVDDGPVSAPVLGLGPIGVEPDRQRGGVGLALMHAVLGAADALDEPLVALLGDPAYYERFGFEISTNFGIEPSDPSWGVHFQVRTLAAYDPTITGTFRYAAPFIGL